MSRRRQIIVSIFAALALASVAIVLFSDSGSFSAQPECRSLHEPYKITKLNDRANEQLAASPLDLSSLTTPSRAEVVKIEQIAKQPLDGWVCGTEESDRLVLITPRAVAPDRCYGVCGASDARPPVRDVTCFDTFEPPTWARTAPRGCVGWPK